MCRQLAPEPAHLQYNPEGKEPPVQQLCSWKWTAVPWQQLFSEETSPSLAVIQSVMGEAPGLGSKISTPKGFQTSPRSVAPAASAAAPHPGQQPCEGSWALAQGTPEPQELLPPNHSLLQRKLFLGREPTTGPRGWSGL